MSLAIHLMGPPRVESDGADRPAPRGHKPWALLALLLLSSSSMSRQRLANLLFGDADDPLGSLRWNLAQVRRLLGPDVTLDGDPVRLQLPGAPGPAALSVGIGRRGRWTTRRGVRRQA